MSAAMELIRTEVRQVANDEMARPPKTAEEFRMNQVAELASEKTIYSTFRLLGVDIRDQDSINLMRDDFSYLREMRQKNNERNREARKALIDKVGAVAVGVLLSIIGYWLGKHGIGPAAGIGG